MAVSFIVIGFLLSLASHNAFADTIGESKGPLCFFCHAVENPDDCETVVACSQHESCYTERYISEENHEFFRLGCKANPICKLLHDFQASHGTTGTNCLSCCDSKYCNQNLCRNTTLDRIQCYTCENVLTPHECEAVTTCDYDEVCATEEIISDQFEIRYNVKCKQKQACALLGEPSQVRPVGKRQDELCDQCCTTPFCNRELCGATQVTYTVAKTTTSAPATSAPPSTTDYFTYTTAACNKVGGKPTTIPRFAAGCTFPRTAREEVRANCLYKARVLAKGPICFQCSSSVLHPEKCKATHVCKHGEVCFMGKQESHEQYDLRCMSADRCQKARADANNHRNPTLNHVTYATVGCCSSNRCHGFKALPPTTTPATIPTTTPTTKQPSTVKTTPSPTTSPKPTTTRRIMPTTAPSTTAAQPTRKTTTSAATSGLTAAPTPRTTLGATQSTPTTDMHRRTTTATPRTMPAAKTTMSASKSAAPIKTSAKPSSTPTNTATVISAAPTCYKCGAFDALKTACSITVKCGNGEQCFVGRDQGGKTQSFCMTSTECVSMADDILHQRQYYHQGVRFRHGRCCKQDLCNPKV